MAFTVKALTGDFACLCDSAAPVYRLYDWNLVWDQLYRRDRHVFLSPRGGNHWKELTRAEISEQSSATGNLSAMGVRGGKKAEKKKISQVVRAGCGMDAAGLREREMLECLNWVV